MSRGRKQVLIYARQAGAEAWWQASAGGPRRRQRWEGRYRRCEERRRVSAMRGRVQAQARRGNAQRGGARKGEAAGSRRQQQMCKICMKKGEKMARQGSEAKRHVRKGESKVRWRGGAGTRGRMQRKRRR